MIAACPKCGARYRIERERLQPEGARLRCSRCEVVFRVRPPRTDEQAAAPAPPPVAAASEPPAPPGPPLILACADPDGAKETVAALERWGFQVTTFADGGEALLAIHRDPPRAVVVDAELPGLGGREICEIVKRNQALRETRVVLVGALDAGAPPAAEGVPAPDGFVEAPDLPDGLAPLLAGFGLPLRRPPRTEPRRPEPPARPQVPAEPGPAPAAPAAAPDDGLEEQREAARRLARIVVSDIVLYNAEKFSAALQAEDVCSGMREELKEGRKLFQERVDERVRGEQDYLAEELRRVAAARSAG